MSDYCPQNHSTLEIFPDELFYELFEYISIYDLSRAFVGLNKRIDHILKSLSHLFAVWTTNTDDRIIDLFAPCISQLVVWRGGHLHLHRFKKLRSLKLALPSVQQCDEIQASATLEHLHIDTPVTSSKITERLSILLLSNAFPRLRTCRVDDLKLQDDNFQPLLTLYSLTTRTPSPARLFSFAPQLVHLRLNLEEYVAENLLSSPHLNLRHLELRIHSAVIDLQIIESILSSTPNLIRLVLTGPTNPSAQNKIEINSLVAILTRHLSQLRFLRISLPLTDNEMALKESQSERETVRRLHPLFNHVVFHPRFQYVPGRLFISSRVDNTAMESQIF